MKNIDSKIQNQESKMVMVCHLGKYTNQLHPYDVKNPRRVRTSHKIHMIEGGKYITEDMSEFDQSSDMGAFQLNQKEYEFFKNHLIEKEFIKVNGYWRERE